MITKTVDPATGHEGYDGRVAGDDDLTTVTPAPMYEVGDMMGYDGVEAVVYADQEAVVVLAIPERRVLTQGGENWYFYKVR